jgi:DNA-binding NarL/FixJ family response regulator
MIAVALRCFRPHDACCGHAMTDRIRVLIVADVRFYREELAVRIARQPDMDVVGTAADVEQVHALLGSALDVVVLDVATLGSSEIVKLVASRTEAPRIIGFGVHEIEREVLTCAQVGLDAFVPCEAPIEELETAVRTVLRDEFRCPPRAAALLMRQIGRPATYPAMLAVDSPLTNRERQVLGLIERGFSNKEIALELGIEVSTVKNHVHNVLDKLHVGRRVEAISHLRLTATMVKADLRPGARLVRSSFFL